RAGEGQPFGHHARHIGLAGEPRGVLEAVGLRGLHEILGVQGLVGGRHAAAEEQLLPLADHAVADVVQHAHLHRQVVGGGGLGPGKASHSATTRGTSALLESRAAYWKPSACAAFTKSLVCRDLSVDAMRPPKNSFCHWRTMPSPMLFSTHTFTGRL